MEITVTFTLGCVEEVLGIPQRMWYNVYRLNASFSKPEQIQVQYDNHIPTKHSPLIILVDSSLPLGRRILGYKTFLEFFPDALTFKEVEIEYDANYCFDPVSSMEPMELGIIESVSKLWDQSTIRPRC